MVKCAICQTREATQQHHLKYEPPITIDICVLCHINLHEHGVGIAKGQKSAIVPLLSSEKPEVYFPRFTTTITMSETPYIVLKKGHEILTRLMCPNGCQSGWELFGDLDKNYYVKCGSCGYDAKFTRTG
jgi:hypothetical protein